MKVIAVNGSPRKKWNTATMLEHALAGAASTGAATELVHLYDYDYKGCHSCFACKLKDGKSHGRCAVRDGLTPLLEKIHDEAGALVFGTPFYFGTMTGMMRSFTERLFFQYLVYAWPPVTLFPRKVKSAWIYTMNVGEAQFKDVKYPVHIEGNGWSAGMIFGRPAESALACETRQFDDYSKYVFSMVDPAERVKKAEKTFPEDCKKAYELGVRLATE
ncbi:MAG: flavodoxin family protein [Acidobacteriota bacterium]|nr:flavodoxin family protein [Acidobacteriota bacterium]